MPDIFLLKNKTYPKDPYHDILVDSHFKPTFIPLLNHVHINEQKTIELLTSDKFLLSTSAIIITSQRAVESLAGTLAKLSKSHREQVFEKPAYTVGPATFKILSELGFKDVKGGEKAGNGDILSDMILEEAKEDEHFVFLTGEIRRDIIPRKLSSNGVSVTEIVIYKTEEKSGIIESFTSEFHGSSNNSKWIVFFSPQGTSEIVAHLKTQDLSNIKIGSIGPTTEKYLIENGIKVDLVSKKPDAQNLFDGINSIYEA